MDPVVPEWYVTFGVQFTKSENSVPHPLRMHADGYAVIEAPDIDMARRIARAIFGDAWASIRDHAEFIDGGMAARWHHDGELLRIAWLDHGSHNLQPEGLT